eukprot:4888432-Amphidinium_carterae.1
MAPKAKKQTKKEVTKSVPKATLPKDVLSGTASSSTTKMPKRVLQRRDSDEKIERQIQSHFDHMTKTELAAKKVDGKTVHEQIAADRAALKASGGLRLGARYWEELVAKFGGRDKEVSAVKPLDANQPLSDSLLRLVECALDSNTQKRTEKPLCEHLRKCRPLNDRELVGVCQAVSKRSKEVGQK